MDVTTWSLLGTYYNSSLAALASKMFPLSRENSKYCSLPIELCLAWCPATKWMPFSLCAYLNLEVIKRGLPNTLSDRSTAIRERAFSAVAPPLWNTLPREIHLVPVLSYFWHRAKVCLFFLAFHFTFLPTAGICCWDILWWSCCCGI